MTIIEASLLREHLGNMWDVVDIKFEAQTDDWIAETQAVVACDYPGWNIINIRTTTAMEASARYEELDPFTDADLAFQEMLEEPW